MPKDTRWIVYEPFTSPVEGGRFYEFDTFELLIQIFGFEDFPIVRETANLHEKHGIVHPFFYKVVL